MHTFETNAFETNVNLLKEFYKHYTLHHSRDIAGSHLRALSKIPHCCLPWEPGPCLSPSVADHPLRSTKDPRLGAPFPHQLSNLVQAHPNTITDLLRRISLHVRVDSYMLRTRSLRVNTRTTCMCYAYRKRSFWARIKLIRFVFYSIFYKCTKRSPSSRRFPYGYLVTTSYQSQYLQ